MPKHVRRGSYPGFTQRFLFLSHEPSFVTDSARANERAETKEQHKNKVYNTQYMLNIAQALRYIRDTRKYPKSI